MKDNQPLYEWLERQSLAQASLFAIVDPHSSHVPHQVFCQLDGQDGGPLLSPHQLINAEDGPWWLPVNAAFLQWWQEESHAQSGILVATLQPDKARAHFASVFQAILEGEQVFFPFYRPEYLAPMLSKMSTEEVNRLLVGNTLMILSHNQWQSYDSEVISNQGLQQSPWWVIKEHHVDLVPNLPLLANNIESWLWQHYPQLMLKRIDTGQPDFQLLFQHYFHGLDDSMPLTSRLVRAALNTTIGDNMPESLIPTEDDELLFALKQTFTQIPEEVV